MSPVDPLVQGLDPKKPDAQRIVFLDCDIFLEYLIDHITLLHFFGPFKDRNDEVRDKVKNFERHMLGDNYPRYKKLELLKDCGHISTEIVKKLENIRYYRNIAAHNRALAILEKYTLWAGKKRELIEVDDAFIEDYKKDVSDCFEQLFEKQRSLNNPDREDLKID